MARLQGHYNLNIGDPDSIYQALIEAERNGWSQGMIDAAQSHQSQQQINRQSIQPPQPQVQQPNAQACQQNQQQPVELESLPFDEVLEYVKSQGYSCFYRKADRKGKAERAKQRAQANYRQLKQRRLNQY